MNPKLESGLIKEALLVSIAIFLLIQAGLEPQLLLEPEFWRDAVASFRDVIESIFRNIQAIFDS